jgi:hypothetical protein
VHLKRMLDLFLLFNLVVRMRTDLLQQLRTADCRVEGKWRGTEVPTTSFLELSCKCAV